MSGHPLEPLAAELATIRDSLKVDPTIPQHVFDRHDRIVDLTGEDPTGRLIRSLLGQIMAYKPVPAATLDAEVMDSPLNPVFTPPLILAIPPISVADRKNGPPTYQSNPQGYQLMKFFPMRNRGVNVWHMNDGTFMMSDPVPGVAFTGEINYPWPETLDPVNNAISSSWFPGGPGGVGSSGPQGFIVPVFPGIAVEYLGSHSYQITTAEKALLTAVGLGAFIV